MINNWAYIGVGLYSGWAYIRGGLIFGGGAYIWNEVSVSTCGGLIQGWAYVQRFTVSLFDIQVLYKFIKGAIYTWALSIQGLNSAMLPGLKFFVI